MPIDAIQEYELITNSIYEDKRKRHSEEFENIENEQNLLTHDCKRLSWKSKLSLDRMNLRLSNFFYETDLPEKYNFYDKDRSIKRKPQVRMMNFGELDFMSSDHALSCFYFSNLKRLDLEPIIDSYF